MATLKHIASKSSNYGRPLEYLMFEHDTNGRPVRDEEGNLRMRKCFIIEGINCTPFSFDMECERLNWQYHKNQERDEIKSHHYILSFDPKDQTECGLTPERAQELGMEFASRCFPGHQTIVCTHDDGHNQSGNIHVHILINSLRKLDVEKLPFMNRDIDSRAGYKHHLTKEYLQYLQEEVMELCNREGLHQVDLLSPAGTKITEKEYRAKENGQRKLDKLNEEIIAAQMKPASTVFQTQKQYLRDAIQDAASQAVSPEEFEALLKEKYEIELKDRRGRYSYLHPDRTKHITGRALGADYEKESLLKRILMNKQKKEQAIENEETAENLPASSQSVLNNPADNEEENGKGKSHDGRTLGESLEEAFLSGKQDVHTAYDPAYDYYADPVAILFIHSEFRLVTDLQTNIKAQMSAAYAQKVKVTNLKEMARTVAFIQEQGIGSFDELRQKKSSMANAVSDAAEDFRKTEGDIRLTNEMIHFTGQYYATRAIHSDFMRSWNKGRFRLQHQDELNRYDEAVRYFKENNNGKIPLINELRERKKALATERERQEKEAEKIRKGLKNLQTAISNVEVILDMKTLPKRQNQELHVQRKKHDRGSVLS
ncbi:relaxase/mobilization nuclease domain-containing protein [Sarcina sp. DSM 11001]|uniref:relaxase/mobilization nuclease domain-containing protein n=1 Tax=Sarcina sp. DSM 11001 TaxID=1798184 RepID=UPI000B87800D|nr:relaxase/mobilization nuclease domain-containing protein [Sarcina sp. DSM 11001]